MGRTGTVVLPSLLHRFVFWAFCFSSFNPSLVQDLSNLPVAFDHWLRVLSKVECGPRPSDGHNIKGIKSQDLARLLVKMIKSCSRIVLALGLAHHPSPTLLDADLEENLTLAQGLAVYSNAEFELAGIPPERCVAWPVWEEEEEDADLVDLEPPVPIQGEREVAPEKTSKVKKRNKISRKRPIPWFDATRPPVFSNALITAPENLMGCLDFFKIPYMIRETSPSRWRRWRPYSYLTGVPSFPPPLIPSNLWRHRLRFVR